MKKIKMMLLSVALIAVVGGALAFKANLGSIDVCYSTVLTGVCENVACPLTITPQDNFFINGSATEEIYCTTPREGACNAETDCLDDDPVSIESNG